MDAVGAFGFSLLFFTETPNNTNGREDEGEKKGEPGAFGHFGEGSQEKNAVESGKDMEEKENDEKMKTLDDEGAMHVVRKVTMMT